MNADTRIRDAAILAMATVARAAAYGQFAAKTLNERRSTPDPRGASCGRHNSGKVWNTC
jgi:hypothetical protein